MVGNQAKTAEDLVQKYNLKSKRALVPIIKRMRAHGRLELAAIDETNKKNLENFERSASGNGFLNEEIVDKVDNFLEGYKREKDEGRLLTKDEAITQMGIEEKHFNAFLKSLNKREKAQLNHNNPLFVDSVGIPADENGKVNRRVVTAFAIWYLTNLKSSEMSAHEQIGVFGRKHNKDKFVIGNSRGGGTRFNTIRHC